MNNQIIRDIQIDLILGNTNPIIDKFNGICQGMRVIELDVFHTQGGELIYYDTNNQWIFYRDDKDDIFWCNYERYWSFFKEVFDLDYKKIQSLTKILVENVLNNNIAPPTSKYTILEIYVENALDNRIATPFSCNLIYDPIVVNSLKSVI